MCAGKELEISTPFTSRLTLFDLTNVARMKLQRNTGKPVLRMSRIPQAPYGLRFCS